MSSKRKRFSEMTIDELTAYDNSANYIRGRADAFDHGKSETIEEYWNHEEPTNEELRIIVKNIVHKLTMDGK